ncbi:MAG TPA: energy-coupling factor transporter ATPase [Peptococcaceae bacterium]|nr:MAG: Energy-coupling factor transporter ATP-binding protein EcfA [Moorella sp. 60_41]HBT47926.1 energy-coupling factor transporter ATPase [Peptococcaceae bacterium]
MLAFEGVSFSYPGALRPALEDINLTLSPGEFVVIMGANGSGKSTLVRLANGLLRPTKGRVSVEGWDTAADEHLPHIRPLVGMVFQDPDNQLVAATVEEDVAFGPENLGLAPEAIRRRVEEALSTLDLAELRQRPPHRLSGGQKQKAALAGILAMEPRYVLLDEATAMLDPASREEVWSIVSSLCRKKGLGIILVTHLPEEAALADRVVILHRGRILREGKPREIFSRPEELTTLGLEAPVAAVLAGRLARRGLPLPPGLLTPREVALALRELAEKRPPDTRRKAGRRRRG